MIQIVNRGLQLVFVGVLAACSAQNNLPENQNAAAVDKVCKNKNALRNPYFGDLHVHTTLSLDANTQGTRLRPDDAYRFAKGERIGIQPYDEQDNPLRFKQLAQPLDFAAVSDHADVFGEMEVCTNPDYLSYNSPECIFYRQRPENAFIVFNLLTLGQPDVSNTPVSSLPLVEQFPLVGADGNLPRLAYCGVNGEICKEAAKTPWREIQQAAAAYLDASDDCNFTTFVAYEYSASPLSNNLHRNVIFKTAVVPEYPPGYLDTPEIELLWDALDEGCLLDAGCDYLTIPHNSNLSAGLMFKPEDKDGNPYSAELAQRRQDKEPLAEIYQHKGQSECLNTIGAGLEDELCTFEVIPYNNLTGDRFNGINTGPAMEQDYLREALKDGLRMEQDLGVNPFKYGFISSTDTHLGTPGVTNDIEFPGHGGAGKPAIDEIPPGLSDLVEYSPGGLAVVWAEQNTRESLFAAMRRKETYGTSGSRPIVRFFGGWDLPLDACSRSDMVAQGYAHGVPMGGDLASVSNPQAGPVFAVSALRDPGGAGISAQPLQRIQIIKGWMDGAQKHEQIFEVAGDPNNGASVDPQSCETSGPGFADLCGTWQDPAFDPAQRAFYYARVVENPSCRWTTLQCNEAGVDCSVADSVPEEFADCCNTDYPKTIQKRAWTSPIWYRPAATP